MDLILPVCTIAALVAFFGGLLFLVRWLGRAVHRAFAAFASAHGLTYADHRMTPQVTGTFEGRAVRVANEIHAMPWGRHPRGVPLFVVEVGLHGPVPTRAWLGRQPFQHQLPADGPRQLLGLGDPAFDRLVYVVTEDEAAVRAWLTPARRAAVQALMGDFTSRGLVEVGNVFVEEGRIVLRMTHMKKARGTWITEVVRGLCAHAPALDAQQAEAQ